MRNYKAALKKYFTAGYGKFRSKFPLLETGSIKSADKDILTDDEYRRLRAVLPRKFQLLFDVLLSSGLRIQELLDLTIKDIIVQKNKSKIVVRHGKGYQEGDKPEFAPLRGDIAQQVKRWAKEKKLDDGALLFPNRFGKPYTSGLSLNQTLQRYCRRVVPPIEKHITNHTFRHMFCTDTYKKCGMETS
jgi:integrase